MTLSPTYDVIVVGARVAGAATAMRLAQGGLRVLLVDRSRHGADTLSTHALMRGGVLQLQRWGLLDRIVDAGTPPVRSTTIRIGNDEIVVPIKPSHGVDALYAPRRTVLDPILVDAAFAAGADVRFGVTVTGVLQTRGRITGIVGRDDSGQRIEVEAGLVIGADGVRSTIANRVDAPVERIGTGATAVIYGYWRDLETSGYEWEFRSGASVGLIPTNDGETCVFAGASPNRVGTGGLELMRGLLQDASPSLAARVAAGTAPLGVRTFAGRPGLMRRAWGPGWALVGDAGYWKDPLSTHGLTDAMRDAELLARAILSAPGPGAVLDDALFGYQETRDRLSIPLFDVTDRIASQRWTMDEISGLLLELSVAMRDEVAEIAAFDQMAVGAC